MKYVHCVAAFMTVALLSGCGSSRIDSGQLNYDNGVAYKHGSTEPFTGIVHFDEPPTAAEEVVQTLRDPAPLYANMIRVPMDNCDVAFKNGAMEGHVACLQRNGSKSLSFDLHRGRLDGEALEYHPDGSKAFDFHWSDGALQGDQAVYSSDGRYVVHAWTVCNGHKCGKEVRRYSDGSDLAEGTWGDDGKFSGSMFTPDDSALYTIKDGVKEGAFTQLDIKDPSLKRVAVEGRYRQGQRDGIWTYHGRTPRDEFARGLLQLLAVDQEDTATVTWKQGTLSGPVKIYDKDQHVLLAFNVADGEIAAPIVRTDPESGKSFTISDDAAIRVMNAADTRGSSMSDSSCLGPMLRQQTPGGVAYIFNQFCNISYVRTHLSDLQSALINHILDPVKFPNSPSDESFSKAEEDAQAGSTPSQGNPLQTPSPVTGLDFCVDDWLRSSYKGGDVIATQDQIDEWKQSCDQGKHPS